MSVLHIDRSRNPDTLKDLCIQFCAENIETFAVKDSVSGTYRLQPEVVIPMSCDKLLKSIILNRKNSTDDLLQILPIFTDSHRTPISSISLMDKPHISNEILQYLEHQPIANLTLTYNNNSLMRHSSEVFNKFKQTLKSLRIEGSSEIKSCAISGNILPCSNLQFLCIHNVNFTADEHEFELSFALATIHDDADCRHTADDCDIQLSFVLATMTRLTHLDLYNCQIEESVMTSLKLLPCLVSLSCCNVINSESSRRLRHLYELKTLRHLDISHVDVCHSSEMFSDPDETLQALVDHLPYLVSLDISGTNLGGANSATSSIPGLKGRQFEFLGLLDCENDPCLRDNLPAVTVTGHGNQKQLLLAVEKYHDRALMLHSAFAHLSELFRDRKVINKCRTLEHVIEGMIYHPFNRHVQIDGTSLLLHFIVESEQTEDLSQKQYRRVIDIALDGFEKFPGDMSVIRKCTLILFQLIFIPVNVVYCYERLSTDLVNILELYFDEDNRTGFQDDKMTDVADNCLVVLKNVFALCNQRHKDAAGEIRAVHILLKIISYKCDKGVCDSFMIHSWHCIWSLTDEAASICEKFVTCDGLSLFVRCQENFDAEEDLSTAYMGIMANISEVKELRPRLMESKYITMFINMLELATNSIEVSCNAAAVIANLASDGPDAWSIAYPCRMDVLLRLTSAIQRWDSISACRYMMYNSFEPILQLLVHFHTPQVQHWALWTLRSFTKHNPGKYCPMLEKENGSQRLTDVLEDPRTEIHIKELIQEILRNLGRHLNKTDV